MKLSEIANAISDSGYTGDKLADSGKDMLGAPVKIAKRNELPAFGLILLNEDRAKLYVSVRQL